MTRLILFAYRIMWRVYWAHARTRDKARNQVVEAQRVTIYERGQPVASRKVKP